MTSRKLAAGAAGLALIAAGGAAAVGASGADTAQAPETAVVKQKAGTSFKPNRWVKDKLRFNEDVYTVQSGGTLRVVNTQADEGPHTVSIVKKKDLPTTFNCPVCDKLAKAHGADPNSEGPPKFQFVENGEGQNDPANFNKPGDSGITGDKKGDKFEVPVTAPAGKTLHFMCIVHPWMQAKLKVE
jgi:plastocyanin